MVPQIKNEKKVDNKLIIKNQKDEEEIKEMLEIDFEKLASKISEKSGLPPELSEAFIDYAKKNPKNFINWLKIINPMIIKRIELEKNKDESTVVMNFNTNIFNFTDSQATVSTGEKSVGTLLSKKADTKTYIQDSIIKELQIVSDNNPEFSKEIKQFEKELKLAKTKKERTSILTRFADWYNKHKEDIQQAEQLIIQVLTEIHNTILK